MCQPGDFVRTRQGKERFGYVFARVEDQIDVYTRGINGASDYRGWAHADHYVVVDRSGVPTVLVQPVLHLTCSVRTLHNALEDVISGRSRDNE